MSRTSHEARLRARLADTKALRKRLVKLRDTLQEVLDASELQQSIFSANRLLERASSDVSHASMRRAIDKCTNTVKRERAVLEMSAAIDTTLDGELCEIDSDSDPDSESEWCELCNAVHMESSEEDSDGKTEPALRD